MDTQTASLLKELASKLGTTAEKLWDILLHQAPINATINLVQSVIIILFSIVLWRTHLRLSKEDERGYNGYDNDAYVVGMIIGAVGAVVLLCMVVYSISDIINGYFNPQYWALEHILDAIKPSK